MAEVPVGVRVVRLDPGLPMPSYAHPGDAGVDLHAAADARIEPGERALLPTGIAVALPEGFAGFIHPRSGLAANAGLGMVNAPGTIDSGYRGEIKVCLINHDPRMAIDIRRGDRVAQLVIQKVSRAELIEVESLEPSSRGEGGFGSSG